ncbi:Endonuclease/exonuclease/phosphatase [Aspergillus aurantiobrunneus]
MEYLNLYFFTYNCALNLIDVDHFSRHFFDALPATDNSSSISSPDLIVLSLQEVAPLAYAFLGGSFLAPFFAAFAQAVDRATARRWDSQYVNVVTDHSGMTGLMVFARSDVVDHLSSPDIARVGLGFQEIGNKGAVASRISYQSPGAAQAGVDLTLIAAHLAPMEDAVARRNADWRSMVERLVFNGSESTGKSNEDNEDDSESAALLPGFSSSGGKYPGIYAPSHYLFLGGDLNYRTADRFPSKEDHSKYPHVDAEPGDPLHYSQLLRDDQLKREMQQSRCFHGLSEASITFPPTYKYNREAQEAARDPTQVDKVPEWKWTNHRWPSWCDRILFLDAPPGLTGGAKIQVLKYDALPVSPTSDHRPVALTVSIPVSDRRAVGEPRTVAPFAVDQNWAHRRDMARKKEYLVGCLAYLGMTREGNGLVLASTIGILGAWFIIRSLLSS